MHEPSALIRERLSDIRKRLLEVRERLFGALRSSRAFKKRPRTNWDFIFFPKIPPIFKLEVGFFSVKKSFSQIFQNMANLFIIS